MGTKTRACSEATTIPTVKQHVETEMIQFCPGGIYQGMFQMQALCQGANNETACPQADLKSTCNISQWLKAQWLKAGKLWHQCTEGHIHSSQHGYPVNVLGVKDICSYLGADFASDLYFNTSVTITKEDKDTCERKCNQ